MVAVLHNINFCPTYDLNTKYLHGDGHVFCTFGGEMNFEFNRYFFYVSFCKFLILFL